MAASEEKGEQKSVEYFVVTYWKQYKDEVTMEQFLFLSEKEGVEKIIEVARPYVEDGPSNLSSDEVERVFNKLRDSRKYFRCSYHEREYVWLKNLGKTNSWKIEINGVDYSTSFSEFEDVDEIIGDL